MKRLLLVTVVLLSVGCSFSETAVNLGKGMKLYAGNCSECHGARGVGQDRGHPEGLWLESGVRLAPALNEKGFVWLYPPELIFQKIKYGLLDEESTMPTYEKAMTDGEIRNLVRYVSSLWPEQTRSAYIGRFSDSFITSDL